MHKSSSPHVEPGPTSSSPLAVTVAALVLCVGVGAVLGSRSLGYWIELGPGPGFFPFWLGAVLAVLGAGWLALEIRARRTGRGEAPSGTAVSPDEDDEPAYSLPTVIAIVGSLCVLAALLEILGYQLSMLAFLLFHLLMLGRRRVLLSCSLAVAGSFGVFVVFTRLLTVPLPASSIPLLRDLGF